MRVEECIVENVVVPQERFDGLWESIVVDDEVKSRLLHHALLGLDLRARLPFATTALHGLLLIIGPPGTGKTTLARALPTQIAPVVPGRKVRLIEVNPHGLMSAEHGQSQQLVTELLCEHVPALADDGLPTILLLDEVESMAVARSEASLGANPADVHRATDAVLASLDRNAHNHPNIVAVATSNFVSALDNAFRSRADVVIDLPLPPANALAQIVRETLEGFAVAYPKLREVARSSAIASVGDALSGADGRRARKIVTEALAGSIETVLNPETLTIENLLVAAAREHAPASIREVPHRATA